jgi:hypothetical protein
MALFDRLAVSDEMRDRSGSDIRKMSNVANDPMLTLLFLA